MFWRVSPLATTSPVETILGKENFTLEELFDEEEIIQECKALNNRLINFLREKEQVQKMIRYIIEEPPENADNRRSLKYPFVACEVFSCEIEVIFKTLIEDQELMDLLFSFLAPDRTHSALLAGYFSKVVICLLARKKTCILEYIHAHQDILHRFVDLIGITSIMEVLIRLVGAEDHTHAETNESMQWLADTDLLEMIVEKLSCPNSPETHTNAAETLCAITRLAPSALATKLASPSFVGRLFHHALNDSQSKSTLLHSLSVCISVLDPKRAMTIAGTNASRMHSNETIFSANPETVDGMLQRLGDLLQLLDVSTDDTILPTTYGELCPPLGKHRLKIIEFIAVLLRTGSEIAQKELVRLGAIQKIIQLFFDYPFNNALHHQVESIIVSCLESGNATLVEHIFQECKLIERLLAIDKSPVLCTVENKPTKPTQGRTQPRVGNIGHLTRIATKINQLQMNNNQIQAMLQASEEWNAWESTILSERNMVENVNQWACGRPTTAHERTMDSDEDEFRDKDYDVSAMANNLSQVFRYGIFDNEDGEELHGNIDKDDEDVFFDDESAEMVVSSLRIGEEQDSAKLRETIFTSTNWFAFQDDRPTEESAPYTSPSPSTDDNQRSKALLSASSGGSSSSDDEVVVGEDEEQVDTATSHSANALHFDASLRNEITHNETDAGTNDKTPTHSVDDLSRGLQKVDVSDNLTFIQGVERKLDLFSVKSSDSADWRNNTDSEGTSGRNPFTESNPFDLDATSSRESHDGGLTTNTQHTNLKANVDINTEKTDSSALDIQPNQRDESEEKKSPSLFEENVEFVGIEVEGTKKAMEHALKEGIVGEAGALKHDARVQSEVSMKVNDENGDLQFNDNSYWHADLKPTVIQKDSL